MPSIVVIWGPGRPKLVALRDDFVNIAESKGFTVNVLKSEIVLTADGKKEMRDPPTAGGSYHDFFIEKMNNSEFAISFFASEPTPTPTNRGNPWLEWACWIGTKSDGKMVTVFVNDEASKDKICDNVKVPSWVPSEFGHVGFDNLLIEFGPVSRLNTQVAFVSTASAKCLSKIEEAQRLKAEA